MNFSFGRNWQLFLKKCNDEQIGVACSSLQEFMGIPDFKGKSFLDIGCGSGLFSYGAFKLGAERVVSIDIDPFSIQCCQHMHEKAQRPANWKIFQGSVLDQPFLSQFKDFDIVYSWGVLHHTGEMWTAIKNSASSVKKGGFYYIAIYNNVNGILGSRFWLKIKKFYNQAPKFVQGLMANLYCLAFIVKCFVNLENPISFIKNYKSFRGMSFKTDAIDWVGGYPYEFATVEEIFQFMKSNFPRFKLVNVKSTNHFGNNWFLYQNEG